MNAMDSPWVRAKIRVIHRSTTVPNVVYKRSWCETFSTNSQWNRRKHETKKNGEACGK